MTEPTRPALRWHGGKWLLAPWIIDHFGPHRVYVEPYGGAASVLLRKPRSYAEYYGDLDSQVVGLFHILRSSDAPRFLELLRLTPYARSEFELAYKTSEDPLEIARRLVVRSFMGFGSPGAMGAVTGFRATSNRSGTTPAHDWANLPDAMKAIVERMQGVVVESIDARTLMAREDRPDALHYVDPPYLPELRSGGNPYCAKHRYRHEMTADEHRELLTFLRGLRGMVVLSGYPSGLYEEMLGDWHRAERTALADGARKRTEVLWLNPAARDARRKRDLFEVAA